MDRHDTQHAIDSRKTMLGIELCSTRIKAGLIGEKHSPSVSGSHGRENGYENGIWTYRLDDVWTGVQARCRNLRSEVLEHYNTHSRTWASSAPVS
jgi:sugar (pentulose or hexulose) kinase